MDLIALMRRNHRYRSNAISRQLLSRQPQLLLPLLILVLGMSGATGAEKVVSAPTQGPPMYKKRTSAWKDVPFYVLHVGTDQPELVRGKQTMYEVPFWDPAAAAYINSLLKLKREPLQPVSVTVFVSKSGAAWAGEEQTFYIETKAGILGGWLLKNEVMWSDSLVVGKSNEVMDVHKAIKRFDEEDNAHKLDNSGARSHFRGPAEERAKRLTPIHDLIPFDFFGWKAEMNLGCLHEAYEKAQMCGDAVRLDFETLERPPLPESICHVRIWIDIYSRKVVKTTWDGKQVYPK